MKDIQMHKPKEQKVQLFKGLEWLIDEIEKNLTSAFNELEAFTQDLDDETKIYFCLGHLHQISGPFKILQCQGLILLAEEMEALTQAIIDREVSNISEACEILVQAIIRLPIYLRQVLVTRVDQPESLILLLNDLRAAQGRTLISESVLFSPDLSSIEGKLAENPNQNSKAYIDLVTKLRQIYQISLIKLIKEEQHPTHQVNLQKVFQRMQELCTGTWRRDLWLIAEQVLGLVASRKIDFTTALKKLFRALDTQLKITLSDARAGTLAPVDTALVKNLLYYLMVVKPETEQQRSLWQQYQLLAALPSGIIDPESNRLTPSYDPAVVRSLVSAIQGELNTVRSALEQYSLEGGLSSEDVCKTLPVLSNMSDALALVGQGKLRDGINAIEQQLQSIFNSNIVIDDYKIAEAVHSLTQVSAILNAWAAHPEKYDEEIELDDQTNNFELERAGEVLLSETRTGIERIKESVVEFINSQWDRELVKPLPALFYELSGALKIINLQRAAAIMNGCGIYVQQSLINQEATIEWHTLDIFADTITVVEYYLEQLATIEDIDQDSILAGAESNIETLLHSTITGLPAEQLDQQPASSESEDSHEPENSLEPETSLEPDNSPERLSGPIGEPQQALTPEPESDNSPEIDNEIIDIFVEEAKEVIETLEAKFPLWRNQSEDSETLAVIRRLFHTLKGSGRMVGATEIGDLAWAVENMLNRILDGRISGGSSISQTVEITIARLPLLVDAFARQKAQPNGQTSQQIIEIAELLAKEESATDLLQALIEGRQEEQQAVPLNESELEPSTVEPDENSAPVAPMVAKEKEDAEPDNEHRVLLEIFTNEAKIHLRSIDHYLIQARGLEPIHEPPTSTLQRALHTLKGTSDMAQFSALTKLITPLDDFVKDLHNHQISVDEDIIFLINDGITFFRHLLEQMSAGKEPGAALVEPDGLGMFYARLAELHDKHVSAALRAGGDSGRPQDLIAIKQLMATGLMNLQDYLQLLEDLQKQTQLPVTIYQQFIAELEDILPTTDFPGLSELTGLLLDVYQTLSAAAAVPVQDAYPLLEHSHETLLNFFDMLAADQEVPELPPEHRQALHQLIEQLPEPIKTAEPIDSPELIDSPEQQGSDVQNQQKISADTAPEPAAQPKERLSRKQADNVPQWAEGDLDREIAGIFVEEAEDIINHLEETLHGWQKNPEEEKFPDRLKRDLHTLKGGARMAGFNGLGQYSHDFEALIDRADKPDSSLFRQLENSQERLSGSYDIARSIVAGRSMAQVAEQIAALENKYLEAEKAPVKKLESEFLPTVGMLGEGSSQRDRKPQPDTEKVSGSQVEIKEVVRIGSETLDTLVNLSGENIIFRGRVEEQVSEFNYSLDEMDATILRLQEQVRRLGTETEAQIDYRREKIEALGEANSFDPLEMDRYSHLQQLSGSLLESASDLYDLKETLADKLVGTESLLIHQSRINTDLQEGLMQTRMVPFSRIVPRLRRIVRQVALELGKQVQLRMDNIQGEMDRTVLDLMVAPLEHMIRNAVDHGIESEKQRKKAKKPPVGTISITTYRQGGDIVIHIADDGCGLDIERIKARAIEKELMHKNALLSDHEIAQFIFTSGFTTADSVSEISGRGVGMDVVTSQVRQLGGSVNIDSSKGKGTQFTVVLPFTLSVNRALMIKVAGDHYALSLNSIDGVHFMSPDSFRSAVASDGCIQYGGREYELQYLGSLLNKDLEHRLDKLTDSVALVLFHSDNRYFAAQVDEVIGTDEIVVKSLGAQFSMVPGVGGATILSDGRVLVIIDLNELARVAISDGELLGNTASLSTHSQNPNADISRGKVAAGDNGPLILVVDDSVTVRKVTSRILKRQGYQVATAKDGVEALKHLQEEVPELMLLDIEMPRMDGFEVAARIRASETLKYLPIIMITSRTGDKHRQRAMEIGVNQYMGKPYQEEQLLEAIDGLLAVQDS